MTDAVRTARVRLDEEAVNEVIERAQRDDNARLLRRLCFIKNLYAGDSITDAAARVGVSQPTGSRWVRAWNEDGVTGLGPHFGGGRPPKLSPEQRERLAALLETYHPLTVTQVATLLEVGFDVSYSPRHLSRVIDDLVADHSIDRPPRRASETGGTDEENLQAALAELDANEDRGGNRG